jgi:hypothetical protein
VNVFAPLDRGFDRFLYASVLEREELPVSVLSALARQGLDPWHEAIRLAGLPRGQAAHSLSETILRCGAAASPGAATETAWRLVELLPAQRAEAPSHASEDPTSWWLAFGIFMLMMAISANTKPLPLGHDQVDRPQVSTTEQTARASLDTLPSISGSERDRLAREGLNR